MHDVSQLIPLQLQSYYNWTNFLCFFCKYHASQIEDLKAKADTQDEWGNRRDESREEGVEGEGANLKQ